MEKQIKHLLNCLKFEYAFFWILLVLLVALYEIEVLPEGTLVGDPQAEYLVKVAGILLAVALIPLSLRLFSLSMIQSVQQRPLQEALVSYRRWCEVRLGLLLVPALINLSVYYWTLDNTGLFCVAMILVASLFCVPGEKRLKMELNLETEEKEEL